MTDGTPRGAPDPSQGRVPCGDGATFPHDRIPEFAVYLDRVSDLPFREAEQWNALVAEWRDGDGEAPVTPPARDGWGLESLVSVARRTDRILRLYFGNEFCEHRIPARRELVAACESTAELGLPLTLMTPPVGDRGLDRLRHVLEELEARRPGAEVVVGDWGVLEVLNRSHPRLEPVLGRLLVRILRDPRVTPLCASGTIGSRTARALGRCSLELEAYRRFLRARGVRRVELDNVHQGIEMDVGAWEMNASLHVPYSYVTTGPVCLPGNTHLDSPRKFGARLDSCPRPCLRTEIGLTDPNPRYPEGRSRFVQRGNTIFFRQEEELVERGWRWASEHAVRWVLQPDIPF